MNTEQELREIRKQFVQQRDPIGIYSCLRLRLPDNDIELNAGWDEFLGNTIVPFDFRVLREPPVFEACFFGDEALLPRFLSLAADAHQKCPVLLVDFGTSSYNFCDAHTSWLFALHRLAWIRFEAMQTDFRGQADRVDDSFDEAAADLFFLINQRPNQHEDIVTDWLQTVQRRGIARPPFVYQRLGRDLFAASVVAIDFVLDRLADVPDILEVPSLVEVETSASEKQEVGEEDLQNAVESAEVFNVHFDPLKGKIQRKSFSSPVSLTRTESQIFEAIRKENGMICHFDTLQNIVRSRGALHTHISSINKKLQALKLSLTSERKLGYLLESLLVPK